MSLLKLLSKWIKTNEELLYRDFFSYLPYDVMQPNTHLLC